MTLWLTLLLNMLHIQINIFTTCLPDAIATALANVLATSIDDDYGDGDDEDHSDINGDYAIMMTVL